MIANTMRRAGRVAASLWLASPCVADSIVIPRHDFAGYAIFGEPETATFGQTFTAPSVSRLASFTFWLNDIPGDDPGYPGFVDFGAYVMSWDGVRANGPVLYSSGMRTTTNNHGLGPIPSTGESPLGFERFDFFPVDLFLKPGA